MLYNLIICEDNRIFNETYQKIATKVAKELGIKINIHSFKNYCDDFKQIIYSNLENKIYILDLLMPGKTGDKIADMIRQTDLVSFIIFITSYHDDYEDVILNGEFFYLKYIDKFKNYENILYDVLKRNIILKKNVETLKIEVKDQMYQIFPNNITTIYTEDRKAVVNNIQGEFITIPITLKELKLLLPNYFVLSKNCCLINLNRIKNVDKKNKIIIFDDNRSTDLVSRKYLKQIINELKKEASHKD